jgi:hypothetical protein
LGSAFRRNRQIARSLGVLCFLFAKSLLFAGEGVSSSATVLEVLHPERTAENRYYYEIVAESTKTELEHAGFSVVVDAKNTTGIEAQSQPEAASLSAQQLQRITSRFDAQFLVVTVFSIEEDEARIRLSWYDLAQGRLVATVSKAGKIDLSFDRTVAEAIEEILTRSEASPVRTGLAPLPAGGDSQMRRRRFEVAIGFSSYLVNGWASDYFKVALMPAACVDYRIPLARGFVAVGLYGAAGLFSAEGELAVSESALIPVGLDLRYGFEAGMPLGVFVHISGGPALLTVDPNQRGRLWKVIPYTMAGLGIDVRLTPFMGVWVETAYSLYFEKENWIYGFNPSLYLCLRL